MSYWLNTISELQGVPEKVRENNRQCLTNHSTKTHPLQANTAIARVFLNNVKILHVHRKLTEI